MKISFSHTYDVQYQVQFFENQEGGMDTCKYGIPVNTIEEAILLLELAKQSTPRNPWMITLLVNRTTSSTT